jgi:hypothetical protein
MSSFKQLHTSDITVSSYTANKNWSFAYTATPNDGYITYYIGTGAPFSPNGNTTTNGEYQSSIYALANQLYYQNYTASLNTQSLATSVYYESASSQRATSSYYDYGFRNNFPTLTYTQVDSGSGVLLTTSSRSVVSNALFYAATQSMTLTISGAFYNNSGGGTINYITYYPPTFPVDPLEQLYTSSSLDSQTTSFLLIKQVESGSTIYFATTTSNPTVTLDATITNNYINSSTYYPQIGLLGVSSDLYGNNILPYTFRISSSNFDVTDDGKGNLISSSILIGNIFYAQGMCVITNPNFTGSLTNTTSSISFQNNYTIFEHEVKCTIKESDFNLSYNPTLQTGSITSTSASGYISYYKDGTVRDFATGSDFSPYTTTVGLYNGDNDLLVIAKLAKPILISPNTDTTFIIKYDV